MATSREPRNNPVLLSIKNDPVRVAPGRYKDRIRFHGKAYLLTRAEIETLVTCVSLVWGRAEPSCHRAELGNILETGAPALRMRLAALNKACGADSHGPIIESMGDGNIWFAVRRDQITVDTASLMHHRNPLVVQAAERVEKSDGSSPA
jgi:hypothetical protein